MAPSTPMTPMTNDRWRWRVGAALAALLVVAPGCGREAPVEAGPTVTVVVTPLGFPELSDVRYRLAVERADGAVVWTRDVGSAAFGDGAGALTFVGPCDAAPEANPHAVTLAILDLVGPNGQVLPAASWHNPAPAEAPLVAPAVCVPDGDTAVAFDLMVMRTANQGFFDVAVTFADIFCSAKADCRRDDGSPLELLFNPLTERREATVVMGFVCTTGQTREGSPEPTLLHFTDVALTCDDTATAYFDPSQAAGQHGALGGDFFQSAIYRGTEELPGYDTCYWNMAFGVDLSAAPRNCRLEAQATASHAGFGPEGHTPANTAWAFVRWQVELTDGDGALICDRHPLLGADGAVSAAYTPLTGASFAHTWACGAATPESSALLCDGAFTDATRARVHPGPDGVSVAIGGQRSELYRLPAGLHLGASPECCVNPCCAAD